MRTGTLKACHTPPVVQLALTLFKHASLLGKANYKHVRAEYQPFAVISNHQLSTNGTEKTKQMQNFVKRRFMQSEGKVTMNGQNSFAPGFI